MYQQLRLYARCLLWAVALLWAGTAAAEQFCGPQGCSPDRLRAYYGVGHGRDIFVAPEDTYDLGPSTSWTAADVASCGGKYNACRTITYALSLATENGGDVIWLLQGDHDLDPHVLAATVTWNKNNVSLIGVGHPDLGHPEQNGININCPGSLGACFTIDAINAYFTGFTITVTGGGAVNALDITEEGSYFHAHKLTWQAGSPANLRPFATCYSDVGDGPNAVTLSENVIIMRATQGAAITTAGSSPGFCVNWDVNANIIKYRRAGTVDDVILIGASSNTNIIRNNIVGGFGLSGSAVPTITDFVDGTGVDQNNAVAVLNNILPPSTNAIASFDTGEATTYNNNSVTASP